MSRPFLALVFALAATILPAHSAHGAIIAVAGGPGDSGPTLGPYTLTPFVPDFSPYQLPIGRPVDSLASPLGGSLTFSDTVHASPVAGADWSGTPSNSFTANVYRSNTDNLVLTLPAGTTAFSFYAKPSAYAILETFTVTAQDGTLLAQSVLSYITGAVRFGFYTTGNDRLQTLTISDGGYSNFFIGQFAIAGGAADPVQPVPEPTSLAVAGVVAVSLAFSRRRRAPERTVNG